MPLQAIEMVLANCPKLTMAAEELYDAYSTVELDASGYPNTGISQSDFVLLCKHTRRLDNNQGLISPEVAILIFRTTGRHLLGHEAPRLNLQQFESVALLCVIMAANLTPQGFVECFEAGRCATFSTLWGSNTSTHIDSDSDPSSVFCIDQRPKVRKGNMSMSFERRYNSATRLPCIVEEDVNSLENL